MKFLLEGKEWPGSDPSGMQTHPLPLGGAGDPPGPGDEAIAARLAAPAIQVAVQTWIAETEDYGIDLLALKNEGIQAGWQDAYVVIHKRHKVIAQQFAALPMALTYIQSIQEHLNEALGKGKAKS